MAQRMGLGVVLFVFLMFTADAGVAGPTRVAMAVLGDSISAGTFAQTHLDFQPEALAISGYPRRQRWPEIHWFIQNKRTLSWASGAQIDSHFMRLRQYYADHDANVRLSVLNVARPGGNSDTLPAQVEDLRMAFAKARMDSLEYVVVLIGANDLCDLGTKYEIDAERFKLYLNSVFDGLSQFKSRGVVRVLVSAIPNIPRIGTEEIFSSRTWLGMSCSKLRRKVLTYCNSLTLWDTPAEYETRVGMVAGRNRLLQSTAEAARADFPELDVVYSNALFDQAQFSAKDLAFDCFHPSHEGQSMISKLLWREQPWFK